MIVTERRVSPAGRIVTSTSGYVQYSRYGLTWITRPVTRERTGVEGRSTTSAADVAGVDRPRLDITM